MKLFKRIWPWSELERLRQLIIDADNEMDELEVQHCNREYELRETLRASFDLEHYALRAQNEAMLKRLIDVANLEVRPVFVIDPDKLNLSGVKLAVDIPVEPFKQDDTTTE